MNFLLKKFVPDFENTQSESVRRAVGTLSGSIGIGMNLLLFLGKLLAACFLVPCLSRRMP